MTSLEDNELLRQYAAHHSEAAFAELVRRHINAVYAIAHRQVGGDIHLAKDVTQIVFTALARKAKSLVPHPVLGGWIYRATNFAATDLVRRERRRRTHELEAKTMDESSNDPSTDLAWESIRPTLDHLMGELKDGDRDAVWLRFFEERSFAEIGAILRLTENAARMRVERALEKLQAALVRRGVKSTTTALAVALSQQASKAAPTGLSSSIAHAALAGVVRSGSEGVAAAKLLHFMSTTKIIGIAAISLLAALDLTLYRELNGRLAAASSGAVAERRLANENTGWDLEDAARNPIFASTSDSGAGRRHNGKDIPDQEDARKLSADDQVQSPAFATFPATAFERATGRATSGAGPIRRQWHSDSSIAGR